MKIKMVSKENGYALVLVLVVMLILFMLGTVLIGVSTSQVREAVKQQERVQAYYLAYSGANAVAEWVMTGGDVPEGESAPVTIGAGSFVVEVEESGDTLTITSSGTVDGYTETVVVALNRENNTSGGGAPLVDMAVFATGEGDAANPAIELLGSRGIVGPAGTNSTGDDSIYFAWSTYLNGDLFVGPGGNPNDVVQEVNHQTGNVNGDMTALASEREYPDIVFPTFPEGLTPRGSFSTGQANVSGRITDINGNGVSGVNLYRSFTNDVAVSQNWNPVGRWIFYSVRGTVTITPKKEGYRFEPESVTVTINGNINIDNNNFIAIVDPNAGNNVVNTEQLPEYYVIKNDGYYDLIDVHSSRILKVDLNYGTRILRVNTFKAMGTIELINVGENGKLMLYIDERFETSGNRNINITGDGAGNNNAFNVFLKGNVPFTHNADAQYNFVGNVVTENGNVDVRAGSSFVGNIFTMNGNVTVSGNATTAGSPILMDGLIYAPNSHVQILGSGRVSGAVVSNTFFTSGDGPAVTFNFQAQDLDFLPFNIFDNTGGTGNGGNAESASWVNPVWSGD